MCERFFSFCDPFLTVCVPCANASDTKTISREHDKTRNENNIARRSEAVYSNDEEHDRLLSVLRQLGMNEHEMTQLLIYESDSLQSISRASAAAAAAANAAAGRISQHDNGGVGSGSPTPFMSNDNNQFYDDRNNDSDTNNDRPTHQDDSPGENATTAYMEVECFVDTTTKNNNTSNNNSRRLLPPKKIDNNNNCGIESSKTNNPFDGEVDNDDLGTVISCREIVPERSSPNKTHGKSYIVSSETLDLVTIPTDESTETYMSSLNNNSNNNTANDVTTDDSAVMGTTAAIAKRKSLLFSIFSRKKSSKKNALPLASSTSDNEWREFTDANTGRKYYSNGLISAWKNPTLSQTMSKSTTVKTKKQETKEKKRSRSTPPTTTSKPTSSSQPALPSSRPRRSKSSPPKQPPTSSSPAYTTTTDTIVETSDDDDDQTLVSKLTFIPDGNVEIIDSYFSSMIKGYRLSTQSFHPNSHPAVSLTISSGATTQKTTRNSSIKDTVPRKGCTVNDAVNAAANSKIKKKPIQVQQSKHMTHDVACYDQLATRSVIAEIANTFESENIQSSNSKKKAARAEEQKIETATKQFSQCKDAALLTKTADEVGGQTMDNSNNIQSSNIGTYEHFQFVLSDSSGCDHTSAAIDRSNYNTNNMMIRLPYNPNTTFHDLRCELMEDYPYEISCLLPNDFKFTVSSANGPPISLMQEQKWCVREYYDLPTQNGSYKNPYCVFIKSNHIKTNANEIAQHDYDGCW